MGGVREYHRVGRYTLSQIGQDEDNEGRDNELINVDSDMSSLIWFQEDFVLIDMTVSRPRWVMSVAVADEDSEETVTDELSRRGRRTSCKGKL